VTGQFIFHADEVYLLSVKVNVVLKSMKALAVYNEGLDTEVQRKQSTM
jgi:hypothetical protein